MLIEPNNINNLEFSTMNNINERTMFINMELEKGDITKLEVDAIVNAAHDHLTGGGGVDGAIHKASGHKLLGECLNLYGCPEGECRITSGYDLPAKYIIHTVGPVWNKRQQEISAEILGKCYRNCLQMAEMQGLKSIAFPCISTGAYCFPKRDAANIAIKTVINYFDIEPITYLDYVFFVTYDDDSLNIYKEVLVKKLNERI